MDEREIALDYRGTGCGCTENNDRVDEEARLEKSSSSDTEHEEDKVPDDSHS